MKKGIGGAQLRPQCYLLGNAPIPYELRSQLAIRYLSTVVANVGFAWLTSFAGNTSENGRSLSLRSVSCNEL